jgi:hypothetical protein
LYERDPLKDRKGHIELFAGLPKSGTYELALA